MMEEKKQTEQAMADIATLGKDGVVGTICFQHNLFMASAIDIKTGIMLPDLMFVVQNKYATIKDFVNDIPNWFTKKFKAVILDVFDFQTPEYANNVEFCKAVQAKLNVNGIPHHFMASQDLAVFTWLYMAKLQVKVEQTILVISVNVIGYRVFCYQLTDKGYIFKDGEYVSGDKSDKMILKKILGIENKFAKILINDTNDDGILCDRLVNNVLHAFTDKITVQKDFNLNPESAFFHIGKCLVEAGKWIRNKKSSNTFILPSAVRQYMILTEIHGIYRALITVAPTVSLPVTESDALHKSSNIKFF
uniref:Uncharacterized protein n=1 Tax=Panagrolaimus sp. ES5 TaxID=591445 RepID=A0AC34GVR8_9BILA